MINNGIEFELAILGESQGQRIPDVFQKAKSLWAVANADHTLGEMVELKSD